MPMNGTATADQQNAAYWAFVCGNWRTGDAYWEKYPWLEGWIPFSRLTGKKVLEVGVGNGTLGRRLDATCDYTAMDVAKETLAPFKQSIHASILDAPIEDESFDYVVTIGCLHHTSDPEQGLCEIHRILRPGGGVSLMVYHKDSGQPEVSELWDTNGAGRAPPFTQWFTTEELYGTLLRAGFGSWHMGIENFRAPKGLNIYAMAEKE